MEWEQSTGPFGVMGIPLDVDRKREKRVHSNDDTMAYHSETGPKPAHGQKYFTMLIGYPAMKRALKRRGWIEIKCGKRAKDYAGYTSSPGGKSNQTKQVLNYEWESKLDLKFALSQADLQYHVLKKDCYVNHNRGEGNLTCKSGLAENLQKSF